MDVPGQVAQLPVMTVAPVLVRVEEATAPYVDARPITMGAERLSSVGWLRTEVMRAMMLMLRMAVFMMKFDEMIEVMVVIVQEGASETDKEM
jgi:hypothetical protein